MKCLLGLGRFLECKITGVGRCSQQVTDNLHVLTGIPATNKDIRGSMLIGQENSIEKRKVVGLWEVFEDIMEGKVVEVFHMF